MTLYLKRILILMVLTFPSWVQGQTYELESIASIREQVTQKALDKFSLREEELGEIKVGHLDSRLVLPRCDQPLAIEFNQRGQVGNQLAHVTCEGSRPWKIYVPVSLHLQRKAIVSRGALPKGKVLTSDDVQLQTLPVNQLRSQYFTDNSQVVGKLLSHAVSAGKVLGERDIDFPQIIRKGQRVILIVKKGALTVQTKGIALASGGIGQHVQVKNAISNKHLEGTITASGEVFIS